MTTLACPGIDYTHTESQRTRGLGNDIPAPRRLPVDLLPTDAALVAAIRGGADAMTFSPLDPRRRPPVLRDLEDETEEEDDADLSDPRDHVTLSARPATRRRSNRLPTDPTERRMRPKVARRPSHFICLPLPMTPYDGVVDQLVEQMTAPTEVLEGSQG